jgi:predicted metalloprotease with PDZ domain
MHRNTQAVITRGLITLALAACGASALGQAGKPITLQVDATQAAAKVIHAHMSIPASGGPLTLFYPKWIPGEHGPTGPLINVVGLKFSVAGKPVTWKRDDSEMHALHLDIPAGATTVEADFDFMLSGSTDGFSSAASGTENLTVLSWNQLLLYPQGRKSDDVPFQASLRLPAGWKFGTALPVAGQSSGEITFKPSSMTTLVDSPVVAGLYFRKVQVSSGPEGNHEIDIVADSAAALDAQPDLGLKYQKLVAEAGALFGARHYKGYRWLLTLSDRVASFGLEHHESSDDRMGEQTLTDDNRFKDLPQLMAHEYAHSWNGKFRRPAGLATGDFEKPMKGELLWVYEGLTQHLGNLLPARTGLITMEEYRDYLAQSAASLDNQAGRGWRPLVDTAVQAQLLYEAPQEWYGARRGTDFYRESELIWLEADTIIRQKTNGMRSLDDFCRRFYGGESGAPALKPYAVDEVLRTLNDVAPYDWKGFIDARINRVAPRAPLGGIENSGWKLIYTDEPNQRTKTREQVYKFAGFDLTLGMALKDDATILDVAPASAAAKSGMTPGGKIIAVNGRKYSADVLHAAVKASRTATGPIEIIVESGEFILTYRLDYHGGERYPHLVRDTTKPDMLSEIAKARASK